MRINKFVAQATGLSRRAADRAISEGRVAINQQPAGLGDSVATSDSVTLDKRPITPAVKTTTIMLNKPVGYVCSREGQGSRTIYDLLPPELYQLKPVGRLDKDSSGLILLTNDGDLANQLTHPKFGKQKVYSVELDRPLTATDQAQLERGVELEDGPSQLHIDSVDSTLLRITMQEGRNRQVRRSFEVLGYTVVKLHRTNFGPYELSELRSGQWTTIELN